MIRVIYYRSYNRLTIEGHAHSGEPGQDLVCAACSALAYTIAANVGRLESQGQVQDVIVQLEPGNAEISCCGIHLPPLDAEKNDENHAVQIVAELLWQ